jgi:Amino acid synthesis
LDQAASILHPLMGKAMRTTLGRGAAIVPSTVKRGAPGAHLDVPLHGLDDEWNFSLIGAVEVVVPDGPASGEIALVVALGVGPHNGLPA